MLSVVAADVLPSSICRLLVAKVQWPPRDPRLGHCWPRRCQTQTGALVVLIEGLLIGTRSVWLP